ncbi:hypothetical protein [Nocardia sp. NPDC059239]|uniref:hypothetical protein n=1 Tax=unclassified Nocardia TaxID=2637762 RepID=UPI003686C804
MNGDAESAPFLQGEKLPSMPGEAPPGMDPVTWRGQAQARDLTGHGRWPDITTTSNREDTEPMNDITHPQQAPRAIVTETEQQMRADFMHAWGSHNNSWDYDPADDIAYMEYAGPWLTDERWVGEWVHLEDATLRWSEVSDIDAEIEKFDTAELSPIRRRSEEQARYIAEHGIERDEHGLLSSHYVTRVEERAESGVGTPSPLADYKPGNALAAHLANSERDGFDR